MLNVTAHDEWFVKKDILRFLRCDSMTVPVLLSITIVPVESSAIV